jgi:hypothetical protein
MRTNFDEMISRIVDKSIEKNLQVDTPEEWEALIQDIRNNFSAHYPESLDVEDVVESVIADQLRRELELPIRRKVELNHADIEERMRREMMYSIRADLKKELEPSVRRELRLEILSQLKLDDIFQ